MKLGIQLFGCSRMYEADPDGFLQRISDMGYGVVEPCIQFGSAPLGWSADAVDAHVDRLRAHGLELQSAHVFAGDLDAALPKMIDVAERAGVRQYVLGYRGAFERGALEAFADAAARAADALAPHGVEVWLHNSHQEIAAKMDGMSAYEWILRRCAGRLGAQIDTGWVVCGGEDLADFLRRNEAYARSIHHKDVASLLDENGRTVNVSLGAGIVDTKGAFEFGAARGLAQIVDQDNSAGDFASDLAQSAAYLRSLGA